MSLPAANCIELHKISTLWNAEALIFPQVLAVLKFLSVDSIPKFSCQMHLFSTRSFLYRILFSYTFYMNPLPAVQYGRYVVIV